MILVLAAMEAEARAVRRGLARSGCDAAFEVLQTGMGLARARSSLLRRLAAGPAPRLVVSSGYAGGWSAPLKVGDWVELGEVWNEAGRRVDVAARPLGLGTESHLCSVAEILPGPAAVCPRFNEHRVLPWAVDMESFAQAEVCRERGLPFQVLRVISDTPDRPFPAFTSALVAFDVEAAPLRRAGRLAWGLAQIAREWRSVPAVVRSMRARSALLAEGWSRWAPRLLA